MKDYLAYQTNNIGKSIMRIFFLAILIGFVIRWISIFAVNKYVKSRETDDKLLEKPGFHTAVLIYLVNDILLKINVAVLLAIAVKTYLL